jgi:hypothetical protein
VLVAAKSSQHSKSTDSCTSSFIFLLIFYHIHSKIILHLKMRFFIVTAALAALASTGSAFVMTTYEGENCGGNTQQVNVWDSSCASWPNGFRSFRISTWGGNHQKAYFFTTRNCGYLPGNIISGYVDATTRAWELNQCVGFGSGQVANAIASYSS